MKICMGARRKLFSNFGADGFSSEDRIAKTNEFSLPAGMVFGGPAFIVSLVNGTSGVGE